MANTDKNIVITPNIGQTADPKIEFSGASTTLGAQTITLNVYPDNNGTLSWEGSAGQLFSITNDLSGTIFSVNDVSGIPSIEVDADGTVRFAEFSGNVLIGTATDNGTDLLQVDGSVSATSFSGAGTGLTGTASSLSIGGNAATVTNGVYTTGDQTIAGVKTFSSTIVGSINGNAATATALQTARNINGVAFDGSADITIADDTKLPLAGGTLTGNLTAPNLLPPSDNSGVVGNSAFTWSNGQFTDLTITSTLGVRGALDLADSDVIRLGSSDDLQMVHNGTHSYISQAATVGDLYIRNLRTSGNIVFQADNSSAILNTLATANGSAESFELYHAGNLKLQTTSTGITVTGAADATDFNSTSDISLKENLKLIESPIESLNKLNGYTFNWKDTKKEAVGVIAQEVEAVFPQMVSTDQNGIKRVSYDSLVPVLLEAIKELSKEIEILKQSK